MAKTIVVIGTGYVGLPAAIMLANAEYKVIGVDIEKNVVEALNTGRMHIDEAELGKLMQKENVRKNLKGQEVPGKADVFIIAVPTPLHKRKKVADLTFVRSAMESVLRFIEGGNLIIVESTIPPLTCREVLMPMIEAAGFTADDNILLAHCPERILPGNIFHDIIHNDRIIGGVNEKASLAAREIYASFVKGKLYITDDVTAELCKLMENTYRDLNVALANEFSCVADTLKIDIGTAIALANRHPRVNILKPGVGVGGHCLPIDPWFITEVDPENCTLIHTARNINDKMPARAAAKIRRALKGITEPKIVALGATYKPNSYDSRESPALQVVELLRDDGYNVEVYDPIGKGYPYSNLEEIVKDVDCLAVLVEHDVIVQELGDTGDKIRRLMRNPIILRF